MSKINFTSSDLMSYLLEEISIEDRERLDVALLADEKLLDELLAAEEALVDAYIHHELSVEKRRNFEERYLGSAQRRTRVDLARFLKQRLATPVAQPRNSWTSVWGELRREIRRWSRPPARLAFAGTLALSLVLGTTFMLSSSNNKGVVTLDLLASVRDAITPPEMFLSVKSEKVQLQLEVESAQSYRDFSVRLRASREDKLLAPHEVQIEVTDPDFITLEFAASHLPSSRIELVLEGDHRQRGRGKIASYFFLVRR